MKSGPNSPDFEEPFILITTLLGTGVSVSAQGALG
jgi:hypothetical protein